MYNQRTTRQKLSPLMPSLNPRSMFKWGVAIIGLILALVILVVIFGGYYDKETVTTTVQDKERVCDSSTDSDGNRSSSCKYLVFTDAGTFEITDALIGTVRFNSSDVYGRIKRCHNYEITSYGWRLPFFSTYPNITEAKDLGRRDGCEA